MLSQDSKHYQHAAYKSHFKVKRSLFWGRGGGGGWVGGGAGKVGRLPIVAFFIFRFHAARVSP